MLAQILLVLAVFFIESGECFTTGAPRDSCLSMYPVHGNTVPQIKPPPFTISVDKPTYLPSDTLTIVIGSPNKIPFKGLEMRVHRYKGNTEVFEGQFTRYPADKLKVIDCFGGQSNMITHANGRSVPYLTIKWQAPPHNIGDIQITATILVNFSVYWLDVKTVVLAASKNPIMAPFFKMPTVAPDFTPIDWSSCGGSKGCFLHPTTCSGMDCSVAMTYTNNDDGTYTFELMGPVTNEPGYIAVGLSKDQRMGEDDVFQCVLDEDKVVVRHAYSPRLYTVLDFTSGFSEVQTTYMDGHICCRFTRNRTSVLYQHKDLTFDLAEAYYLQLAWGGIISGTKHTLKHAAPPLTTHDLIYLNDNRIHTIVGTVSSTSPLHQFPCLATILTILILFFCRSSIN